MDISLKEAKLSEIHSAKFPLGYDYTWFLEDKEVLLIVVCGDGVEVVVYEKGFCSKEMRE